MLSQKRLLKDAQKLVEQPIIDVMAVPRENNLMLWDAGIVLRFPDDRKTLMHLLISIPEDYPKRAPAVGFSVRFNYKSGVISVISNPNSPLHNKYGVCLNVTSNYDHFHTEWQTMKGSGWSSSLDIGILLVNLQSILAETISNENTGYTNQYDFDNYSGAGKTQQQQNDILFRQCEAYLELHKHEIPSQILSILNGQQVALTTKHSSASIYTCWYTYMTYKETILGYPIIVGPKAYAKAKPSIFVDGEYLSIEAYEQEKVRLTPMKETFQYFLPAYICPEHANQPKWFETVKATCLQISKELGVSNNEQVYTTVLTDLINSLIVKMMDRSSDISASLKYFGCILNLWRILVRMTTTSVTQSITKQLQDFVREEQNRNKQVVPNIGYLLIFASLCKMETSNIETSKMETSNIETSKMETSNIEASKMETSNIETIKIDTKQPVKDESSGTGGWTTVRSNAIKNKLPVVSKPVVVSQQIVNKPIVSFNEFVDVFMDEFFLRLPLWWQKSGTRLPITSSHVKSLFDACYIGRTNILFQLLFYKQILSNKEELMTECDTKCCELPERCQELLTSWKDMCKRLTKTPTWTQYFTELVSLGYSESKKQEICASLDTGMAFLTSLMVRAKKIDGYHVKQKF